MQFLKAILGDELYAQFEQAVNAYNGKPENKEKQVKLADLGSGEYVSKAKFDATDAENKTNVSKLTEANNLIKQLQTAAKGDENLQSQITTYQTKVQQLETELQQTKIDAAIKVAFISSGAKDTDYLLYKLKEMGNLELDESGNVKGLKEKMEILKAKYKNCFEKNKPTGAFSGVRIPSQKPAYNDISKSDILKMGYAGAVDFFNNDPQRYRAIMNQ